jgi:hypothetical protein
MDHLRSRGGPHKIHAILHGAGYRSPPQPEAASAWETWTTPPTNYIGTAIFLSYIVGALALTLWILTQDIAPRWSSCMHGDPRTRLLVTAAIVSFSVLSMNMIAFLYYSYTSFLETSGLGFSAEHFWPWMLNTNLFTTFARQLLADESVTSWAISGLLMTMLIGRGMSTSGACGDQDSRRVSSLANHEKAVDTKSRICGHTSVLARSCRRLSRISCCSCERTYRIERKNISE